MAKTGSQITASIRDIVQRPSTATISVLDPAQGESPIDWRYTTSDIFGNELGLSSILPAKWAGDIIAKVGEEKRATTRARAQALAESRPVSLGARLQAGSFGSNEPGYLNGIFTVLDVPFNVGELRPPGQPAKTSFERSYVPSYGMRVRTEMEIIRSGIRNGDLADFVLLTEVAPYTIDTRTELDATAADAVSMRRQWPLSKMISEINRLSVAVYGGRASQYSVNAPPGWILKPVLPTEDEWSNEWGTYKYFQRGGFLIDLKRANGTIPLNGRNDGTGRGWESDGGRELYACAGWVRDTGDRSEFPTGRPVCVVPVTLQNEDVNGWDVFVDVVTNTPAYWVKVNARPASSWDHFAEWLGSTLDSAIHAMCSSDEAHKAILAAIAFAKLQGKSAQEAKAKAKTAKDVANAAALAAQYNTLALEIQLAALGAHAFCNDQAFTADMLPSTELPGLEPQPRNPKFNVDEMYDAIRYRGPLSLSPERLAQPGWSKVTLTILGLLGAAGGAYAYQRKRM